MLTIRLQKTNKKYQYNVVVINANKKLSTKSTDRIGVLSFKNTKESLYPYKKADVKYIKINLQKLYYWISIGVTISPSMKKLLYSLKVL
jgi:ribosomal protein S16